ncbi:tRNA (adenosine(37)-N6)-threonylcarbamoyltransferase complex dimerization subunit type 1 TsaB [Pseudoroseomonas globiformis]|uniref:tRNA (Adenosine(37)-N6)-threonylcarbamoyltransferase complex dimerization subunit type 1 TsaB n=1 Tax=Teichococcus globiformis TaxID=2307229 RepID=A0ABV7FZ38_9PROT
MDGALARASAAVWADGHVLAHAAAEGARGQAVALPPMVADVLRRAGLLATELDAVAAVVGPGGFTGLRAALALAQGLALAAGKPAIGVTTGEALAAALPDAVRGSHPVWSVTDTRRGRVLLERLVPGAWAAEAMPQAFTLDAVPHPEEPTLLVGDAAEAVAAASPGHGFILMGLALPDAAAVAAVAARRLSGAVRMLPALPLYVEPPAVRLPSSELPHA